MDARRMRFLAFVLAVGTFGTLEAAGSPLWTYVLAAAVFGVVALSLNRKAPLPSSNVRRRQANDLAVYVAGSVAIGALGVAAAIANSNALLGVGGVAAAIALLTGIWLTARGPD